MEKRINEHLHQTFTITNLQSLIKGYILNCRCEGKSPKTLSFYQDNLNRFLWYCFQNNFPINPSHITTDQIRQFLYYVASKAVRWGGYSTVARKPVSRTTVAHYYHCLNIFFNWLKGEGIITQNPLARINRPKKDKKIIQALSAREIGALLDFSHLDAVA